MLDRLRQNRVRPQFDEQACAVLEQSLDSTIEAHHSAGIAHPVGGVGVFALQVSGAAGNPWNFRGIRLDVGETGLDVGKARLHLPRMERIGCRHQEGEPAGFSQALFQGGHGARLTGYHAGDVAVDHRDFQRRAKHGLQLFGGSPDHHHAAAAEGTLHGVGAVIDDLYRRAQVQGAGAPGRRHLAHRMPNHRAWRDTPAAQAFGEGDLDGENRRLGDFGQVQAGLPAGLSNSVSIDQPDHSRMCRSHRRIVSRKAGSRCSRPVAMPSHCAPWPV